MLINEYADNDNDTYGNVYLQQSAITNASAAETAAVRKTTKYSLSAGPTHPVHFTVHYIMFNGCAKTVII